MSAVTAPVEVMHPSAVAPVEPLSDELAPAFLEALERTGSVRGSAREIGVNRQISYERRYRDPQFGAAWNAALSRRMRSASDDLFASIDELVKLTGGDWEKFNGEDAHGLYLQLRVIAELLDIVGWPVRKDAATMNEHIDVLRGRGPIDPEGVE